MLLNFPANGGSILQTNIWKMKILICGFLSKSTILKSDQLTRLASIFSLQFIEIAECQPSSNYRASNSRFFSCIYCKSCSVCPPNMMAPKTVERSALARWMIKNTENHWSKLLFLQTSLKSIISHYAFLTEITDFHKLQRFPLTFYKIPRLFPDFEKFLLCPDFSLTVATLALQWREMTSSISSHVRYGKYATTVPDVTSYEFYEWCISQ